MIDGTIGGVRPLLALGIAGRNWFARRLVVMVMASVVVMAMTMACVQSNCLGFRRAGFGIVQRIRPIGIAKVDDIHARYGCFLYRITADRRLSPWGRSGT